MAEGYEPRPLDINPDNFMMSFGAVEADANALFKNGIYRNVNGEITNTPNNDANGILIVFQASGNSAMQLYINFNSQMYTRINWAASSVSWNTWVKII